jgi:heme exporter protein B
MTRQLLYLLLFEFKNASLRPDGVFGGVLYFLLTLMIMPFTLKIANGNITHIAPTMIWVAIIPAILTASSRIFSDDCDDGFIDRYALMNLSWCFIFIIKIIVLFLFVIIPALCIMPILSILFSLPFDTTVKLMVGLVCSIPAVAFFTGFGALLSVHGKIGHIITFVIVTPLIIPAIILGAGVVYTTEPLIIAVKLPIAFSLIAILITVPAGGFLYKQLYEDR